MPQQLPTYPQIARAIARRAVLEGAAAIALGSWPARSSAQATQGGDSWLRRTIERAADLLTTPGTDEERIRAFSRLLADEAFDFDHINRYVLGNHWNQSSAAQRAEFSAVLVDYLVVAYARILRRLFAGTIDVFAARIEKDGLTRTLSDELAQAEQLLKQVDWTIVQENEAVLLFVRFKPREGEAMRTMVRLVRRAPAFRIVDIWVNGVSLARTHRDDVAGAVRAKSGDMNATIEQIRRKTEQLRKG